MNDTSRPPAHIVAAFGVQSDPGECLPGVSRRVWRYGDIVLRPTSDPVFTAWESGVFESLRVSGLRVARPVRSLDGRWVVGGFRAQRFLSGRPAPRYVDMMDVAFELDMALEHVAVPQFVANRSDRYGWADQLSWDPETDAGRRLGDTAAARLWFELAAGRTPVQASRQIIHGDVFGNVLFAGSAPPAVIDFLPLARPAGFAAALVAVDAIAWGRSRIELAGAVRDVPQWGQMLRHACLFRLAMVLTHPRGSAGAVAELVETIGRLRPIMS